MRIAIIGANGQLGWDLCRLLGGKAVPLTHEDIEVCNPLAVKAAFDKLTAVQAVINTAAFHRVDECEEKPEKAFEVNALGAYYVAREAARRGWKIIYISTDYVFEGTMHPAKSYAPNDLPNPLNIYGLSKLLGEHLTRMANPNWVVVRSSVLFGQHGSRKGWNLPDLMVDKLRREGKFRAVVDKYFNITYTKHLGRALKELAEDNSCGIFHLANEGTLTAYELACELQRLLNLPGIVQPVRHWEIPSGPAKRPRNTPIYQSYDNLPDMPPWRKALKEYVEEKYYAR